MPTPCNIGLALNLDVTTSKLQTILLTYLGLSFHEDLMPPTTVFQRIPVWAAFAVSCQVMSCAFNSTSVSRLHVFLRPTLFLLPCKFPNRAWRVMLDGGFLGGVFSPTSSIRFVCLLVPVPLSSLVLHL